MGYDINNINKYADDLLAKIDACIVERIKNTPQLVSAIVSKVNEDGTVNVYFPPNEKSVFTKIQNQSVYDLQVGDSVEIVLKDGTYSNCWILAKHGVNQAKRVSEGSGGSTNTIIISGGGSNGEGSGSESDVFYAIYGTTTFAEIKAAHDAGKAVYMKKGTSRSVYPLITLADSFAQFAFVAYNGYLRRCTCDFVNRDVWREDESALLAETPVSTAVTLSASGWNSSSKTQTVTVSGVLADETKQLITPAPAAASQAAYYNAGIRCTNQAANSLTFTAKTIPTADLTVYVTIQEVSMS